MEKLRISIFTLLVCIATFRLMSIPEPSTAHIKVLTVNEGLPDNSVNDITEDKNGFIWIATWNGLARFDGRTVTPFRHPHEETNNYLSDMVRCIGPDKDRLWVGSDTGLDFFRFLDNSYYPCSLSTGKDIEQQPLDVRVSKILIHHGEVFALTINGDILRLDRNRYDKDMTKPVFIELPKPRNRRYADITGFMGKKLLALSNDGITLLSPDGEGELYHNTTQFGYDPNLNIFFDKNSGTVTVGAGVGSQTREFHIDSNGKVTHESDVPPYSNLMATASDGETLYYGTDGNGMFVKEGAGLIRFTPDNSQLPCDAIYKVYVDSNHNLWIGSYRHGVFMLSHNLNAYSVIDKHSGMLGYDIVTAVIPDGDSLYLGLDGGGIEVLDTRSGAYRLYNKSNSGLPADNVVSLVKNGGTVWAAIYGIGLVKCNLGSRQFETFKPAREIEPGCKLWIAKEDEDGNLWIGGNSLSVFDPQTKEFKAIPDTQKSDVLSIAIDGNMILVSTRWNGLLQVDRKKHIVRERHSDSPTRGGIRLPGRKIPFVFVDSKHNVWVDIDNTMICRIDLKAKRISKTFRHSDGDNGIQVLSMAEDRLGNILIGTNHGLLKYMKSKDVIIPMNDERMPRMFTFNAVAKDGDTAYFGTTSGLLRYPLREISEKRKVYGNVFTGLEVLNNKNEKIPLYCAGDTTVELTYDQNFFKVNFTVPEMTTPEQLKFEWRLEGFEDEWRDVTDTRSAIYTYVPAGKYRMQVRHTLSDGNWSTPATLTITIKPAWYASPIMILVWFLLFIGILASAVLVWRKYNKNREKTHIAELERDSSNRLNEAKLDFYASITHELRTPCFLISAQIEELYDSGRQTIPVGSLAGIYRNSAKLNKLISNIIDFRKTDTGHLTLNARKTDLLEMLNDLSVDYEQLCRQKSISFNLINDSETPVEAEVDPDKLELIVTNLISNAYKYTGKGGSVSLEIKDSSDNIAISVKDNGIGIVDKLQSTIFQPFMRTERGRKASSGDGIGLAFVKELVELHHGTITVESKINEGSCFTVTLPKHQPKGNRLIAANTADEQVQVRKDVALSTIDTESSGVRISDPTATRSIMLIDDNPDILSVLAKAFEEKYRVTEMTDAKTAVETVKNGGYDIVITDIMMPDFDGHEVIKTLKEDKHTREVKIVVLSVLTSETDMITALDEGADAYLTKPMPVKALVRQVESLLEKGAATSQYRRQAVTTTAKNRNSCLNAEGSSTNA